MRYLFNEGWKFLRTEVEESFEEVLKQTEAFLPVQLPHDWLIYDSLGLYEDGRGWYLKDFFWEEETKKAFLTFEGIYMDSAVYVNGYKAGEWKYGYSSFTLDITGLLKKGENRILVSVCHQSPNSRWYSGAGIYRDVWLTVTEQTYLKENEIYISTSPRGKDFVLRIEVAAGGPEAEEAMQHRVVHQLYGPWVKEKGKEEETSSPADMELLSHQGNVWEYLAKEPAVWDVEDPQLYVLETSLMQGDQICQQKRERFGFRSITFSPEEGFILNGRRLKLNGVCEHHDLGALGAAFHLEAMRRKLRILKEMGVNAVRGSHNMMAPGFLDLADEMGILLISEAFDMWERSKTTWDYARFFPEWHERDVESWVTRDRNHPSVIMWSIGNEIYDTHANERGQEITRRLKSLVEKYDPCRNASATIASNYMPWENAQKCADIVKLAGYNYSEKYYREHHEKHPDWVIYGSETSSIVQSRGVYHFPLQAGILAEDDLQCSSLGNSATSWGARSMEECIAMDRDMPFSMGQFLWTGFDYIGEPTPYHTKNSYFGQIDTAGFPKDSYYVWQSAWTDPGKASMIHIFPYWDFNSGQLIDVRVCTNGSQAELFLNGRSLGRQTLTHEPGSGKKLLADYCVPYEEGVLTAVAYDKDGNEIARTLRSSFGNSAKIVLRPEKQELCADGRDLLFVEISTVDEKGRPVENACDRIQVEVAGDGRLVGLDNGDSTDYDSYKGRSRRLFSGKLLAIIQADKLMAAQGAGQVRIKASCAGLKEAELVCACIPVSDRQMPISWSLAGEGREENTDRPIHTGKEGEIPVRKILLMAREGQCFTADKRQLSVEARIEPENAQDQELIFAAVNEKGVPSNLVKLTTEGKRVSMEAIGDGEFYLRCMSKSGTDHIRLISQLEFSIQGLGPAYLDPYDFISGSLYSSVIGEAGSGNERGVATARDGETTVTYSNIDFGSVGSDQLTVPIFALSDEEYPIQIWEGIPQQGGELLAEVVYQKPSRWNVYQPETWQLKRPLKGITSLSFRVHQKIHIKGFSFARPQRAWMILGAEQADAIYGDSYRMTPQGVEEIGNNVSLVFGDMDFGQEGARRLVIRGRAKKGNNTIHVRFFDGQEESKQIVEFPQCEEYEEHSFTLQPLPGSREVTFVFLPGSCFDFEWFQFKQ